MDLRKASRRATAERRRERAADEGDVAMAKGGQVLHALANALAVVDFEDADIGQVGSGIDKDERELALDELLDQVFFDAEGHHGNAVDVALQHAADERLGAGRFVVGGADQHFVSLGHGEVFELLHQLGEKRIGDFRDDEAQHAAAA